MSQPTLQNLRLCWKGLRIKVTSSLLQLDLVVFAVYIYVYLLHGPTSGEVSGMDEHIAGWNLHLCKVFSAESWLQHQKRDKKTQNLVWASEKG